MEIFPSMTLESTMPTFLSFYFPELSWFLNQVMNPKASLLQLKTLPKNLNEIESFVCEQTAYLVELIFA